MAPLRKWLSQFDFGRDHDCLLLFISTTHTNKCRKSDFVTKKIGREPGAVMEDYNFGLTTARACS